MPFIIIRNDITKVRCDAIVNAANHSLLGGGGVDGAIHRAAGPALLEECRTLGGCATGEAKITGGYRLPAKYVIHTVGPIWQDGLHGEPKLLASCYSESLRLAVEHGCQSVAFPLISAGAYGYPKDEALRIARESILAFLETHELTVFLVVFGRSAFRLSASLQRDIAQYIDDAYADARRDSDRRRIYAEAAAREENYPASLPQAKTGAGRPPKQKLFAARNAAEKPQPAAASQLSESLWDGGSVDLDEVLSHVDESFSQMLLRKIDERGMTDAACYKKANVDRKLFSKIRGDVHYRPSKPTAIAFALALELSPAETDELLRKAGYALSRSSKFDLIIEFFLRRGNYNIYDINEALFAYDQPLLGG